MAEYNFNKIFEQVKRIEKALKGVSVQSQKVHNNLMKFQGENLNKVTQATAQLNTNNTKLIKTSKELNTVRLKTAKINKAAIREANKYSLIAQKRIEKERQLTKAVKDQARVETRFQIAVKGSIEKMRAGLAIMQLRHKNLQIGTKREIAYRKSIEKTTVKLKALEARMGNATRNVGNYGSALKKVGANIMNFVKGMGLMFAAYAALRIAKEAIELFKIQEQAVKDNEKVFGSYSKTLQKFASDIQKVTRVGDEQTIALTTQALNFGITADKVKEATKGTIGLAEKFKKAGLSQETALKGVALAYQGNFSQLERYIPSLRNAGSETEKMTILQEEMAIGFDLAKASAMTSAGQIEQFKNEMGDIKEEIGRGLMPVVKGFIALIRHLVSEFKSFGKDLIEPAKLLSELTGTIKIFNSEGEETQSNIKKIGKFILNWGNVLKTPIKLMGIFTRQLRVALQDLGLLDSESVKNTKNLTKKVTELTAEYNSLGTVMKKEVGLEFQKLNRQLKSGEITNLQFANSLNKLILKLKEVPPETKQNTEAFEEAEETARLLAEALSGVLADAYNTAAREGKEYNEVVGDKTVYKDAIDNVAKLEKQLEKGTGKTKGKSFLERLFGFGESETGEAFMSGIEAFGGAYSEWIDGQIEKYGELITEQQNSINETEDLLKTELDRINELKNAGQAYDNTKADLLKKQLVREKEYLSKSLAEEKKAKEKRKNLQYTQSVINLASGIMSIWGGDDNFYVKLIQSAILAGIGVIELANISGAAYAEGTEYVKANGAPPGIDTVKANLTIGEGVITKDINQEIPYEKGFTHKMLPAAANLWLNREKSNMYVNNNGEVVDELKEIRKNTSNDIVRNSDGKITRQKKGNHYINYN